MSDVAAVGRGLPLGGPKQRAALAALLLRANETVPAAKIVDDVWGEHPPATAAATLEVYVSRLRGLLGRGEEVTIEKRPAGYMLRAPDAAIDAHRFQQLTQAGRRSAREDPGAAAELFREALGLWRGAPLEDVVLLGESSSEPERLEEMQLRAREDLLELRLRSEAPDALLDELDGLVRRRPFREQLRGALMLSLYRSGRQAEALAVYEAGRRALVDELGLSPSHELRQLASAIVRQEAALDVSSPSLDARPDSRAGSHLRWATAAALGLTLAAISIFAAWIGSNVGDAAPSAAAARPRVTLVRWQAPPAARAPLEDLQREGLRRAALAYGVRTRVVAANQSPLGAEQALEAAARRADLVIASVSSLAPAVAAVAPRFPRTRFAVFDTSVVGMRARENVTGVVFGDEQAGFLAGYAAASMERRRSPRPVVVSAVAGLPVPSVERLLAGYEAGAIAAVPGREFSSTTARAGSTSLDARRLRTDRSTAAPASSSPWPVLAASVRYRPPSCEAPGRSESTRISPTSARASLRRP